MISAPAPAVLVWDAGIRRGSVSSAELAVTRGPAVSNRRPISKGGTSMKALGLTEFVEANGIRFAYRRFGAKSGVPPVFFSTAARQLPCGQAGNDAP